MIQSLDVPVVSLSVPNIHKLAAITSDDLSCMWTVFTKCKDNLENGRRLENMSWRLWYRESLIEKAQEQHVRTPIPIQQSNAATPKPTAEAEEVDYFSYASSASSTSTCSTLQTPPSLKHVSPSSFKRMISSLNTPIEPYTLISPVPQLPAAAAAAPAATAAAPTSVTPPAALPPSTAVVADIMPEKVEITAAAAAAEPPAKNRTTVIAAPKPITARSSKFFLSDDEDEDECDNDDSLTNMCDNDDGFWSTVRSEDDGFQQAQPLPSQPACLSNTSNEFAKRILTPAPLPTRRSLLTSMLNANPTNPMARPRRLGQRKRPSNDAELSQSLRYCVDWEHQQNAYLDEFMAPPITTSRADESSVINNYWDSFQGW